LAVGGVFTTDTVDSGDFGAFAIDASRRLFVSLEADNIGLATGANQTTIIGHVDGIEGLLTTIDSDTGAIKTAVEIIDNAISGNEMQVDVITMPSVTVTATQLDIDNLNTSDDIVSAEGDGTALGNGQVTVDTTVGGTVILSASAGRAGATLKNQGSNTVFIGTGTVTISNGIELKAGESIPMPTDSEIKGITSSGSATIGYLSFA